MNWLDTLTAGIPVNVCTPGTDYARPAEVKAITATEIRCGRQRFARDGRGIGSTAWLEPFRQPRPIGRPRKQPQGVTP